MSEAANRAKAKWNAKNYKQVKMSVSLETAAAFKSACAAAGVSMAGALSKFMGDYTATPSKRPAPQFPTATRGQRRTSLKSLITHIERIRDAEENYRDNIPENLRASVRYSDADDCVSLLGEAIDALGQVY